MVKYPGWETEEELKNKKAKKKLKKIIKNKKDLPNDESPFLDDFEYNKLIDKNLKIQNK